MKKPYRVRNRIAEIRAYKGLSQSDLARAVGVSKNQIYNIEKGVCSPSVDLAMMICKVLQRDINDVFTLHLDPLSRTKLEQLSLLL